MAATNRGRCGRRIGIAIFLWPLVATLADAQSPGSEKSSTPPVAAQNAATAAEPAPADSALQREYARLAQQLNSTDSRTRREAADTLLRVRPNDVANPETRKLIARGYRTVAIEDTLGRASAVRGLVIWGGQHSVPILVEMMEKEKMSVPDEIFDGLATLKDPRGAEAVGRHLGNFFNNDGAIRSLRRMGSVAEDALIKAAPSNDPKVSLAAVQLLGDVGSAKSLPILQKAVQSRNEEIKLAARESVKRIRERMRTGETVNKPSAEEGDSPFSATAGPPVDITARNSGSSRRSAPRARAALGAAAETPDEEKEATPVFEGDWSQVTPLLPGDPAGAGVPADPAASADSKSRPQPVRLSASAGARDRPIAMSISTGAPVGAIVYGDSFRSSIARLELISLKQSKSLSSTNIMGGAKHLRVSPQGTRLLIVNEDGTRDRQARLIIYGLEGGKSSEIATWWPYASGASAQNQVNSAEWIDEERFLTLNGAGMLVHWRLDGKTPRAIYQIDANRNSAAALSGGRAHLALSTARGLEIVRPADGSLLARMNESRGSGGPLAFSPKGDRLALITGKNVRVWNATNGALERDFDCPNLNSSGTLDWLDDRHLLVGGTDIVDFERRLLLWRYEIEGELSRHDGRWLWSVMSLGNARGLVPAQLMHEKILAAGAGVDADAILALKPGSKVSLDLALGGEAQAKADASLRAAIERSGMTFADGQPLRLRAQIVTGKTSTQEYGRAVFGPDRQQVTVTETNYEVELTIDGQSLWKQSISLQSSAPLALFMKRGETAQQTVDRENQQRNAGYDYGVASIPKYIVHPKYAGPLGTSKLTPGGIE